MVQLIIVARCKPLRHRLNTLAIARPNQPGHVKRAPSPPPSGPDIKEMDTKERTDSLKDEIADVRRQLTGLTGSVGEIGGAVKNLEKAIAKLKG